MSEVTPDQLQAAVESMHNCRAVLAAVTEVHERFGDETIWHGVVHTFNVTGNPVASVCYAWSSPVEGSERRRFFAVLGKPPVLSPADAVRAAIASERAPP